VLGHRDIRVSRPEQAAFEDQGFPEQPGRSNGVAQFGAQTT
jgi:hypothetical protein